MEVTVQIPDDIAARIMNGGGELSRKLLESFALDEYKAGQLTEPELCRLLGYGTRYQMDGFLKAHGFLEDVSMEDIEQDVADIKSLGL